MYKIALDVLKCCCFRSKLRTDAKVRDIYKIGKTLGTGGEQYTLSAWHIYMAQAFLLEVFRNFSSSESVRVALAAGFAVVKLATERATGGEYAVKIMALPERGRSVGDNENSRDDIFKEIDILVGLNHPNVIYLKEYFEENNRVRH